MDYDQLRLKIQNSIKGNASREITGFLLQEVLLSMVDILGADIISIASSSTGKATDSDKLGGHPASHYATAASVTSLANLLTSIWKINEETGDLVTDRNVIIKKNVTIGGDTSTGGTGEDTGVSGTVTGIRVDANTILEPTNGIVDMSDVLANLEVDVDLSDYYTALQTDAQIANAVAGLNLGQYAKASDLATLQTEVDHIESVLGMDEEAAGIINTWNEVKAFLGSIEVDDDLASILERMNANIDTRALDSDLETLALTVGDNTTNIRNLKDSVYTKDDLATYKAWWDDLMGLIVKEGSDIKIKTNLIIAGDTSSEGTGESVVSGITGIKLNGTTYKDENNDGIIDLGTITGGLTSVSWSDVQGRPTKVSEFLNDSGFITSAALLGYATQSWVEGKGYITGIDKSMVASAVGSSGNAGKVLSSTGGDLGWISLPTSLPASDVYAWAKKSSLALVDIPDLSSMYLSVNGGTITRSDRKQLLLKNSDASGLSALWIGGEFEIFTHGAQFLYDGERDTIAIANFASYNNSRKGLGALRITKDNKIQVGDVNFSDGYVYDIIHSGNIGDYTIRYHYNKGAIDFNNELNNGLQYVSGSSSNGGKAYDIMLSTCISDSAWQLVGGRSGELRYRGGLGTASGWGSWKTVAFTDSTVAAANKVITADGINALEGDSTTLRVGYGYRNLTTNIYGNEIYFAKNGTIQMLINSSGNVTIGSTDRASTTRKLFIEGNTTIEGLLTMDGNVYFYGGNKDCYLDNKTYGGLAVRTNSAVRMVIGDNVLIGTTSDSGYKLDVNGTMAVGNDGDSAIYFRRTGYNRFIITKSGGGAFAWRVDGSSTDAMVLASNGNLNLTYGLSVASAVTMASTLSVSKLTKLSNTTRYALEITTSANSHIISFNGKNGDESAQVGYDSSIGLYNFNYDAYRNNISTHVTGFGISNDGIFYISPTGTPDTSNAYFKVASGGDVTIAKNLIVAGDISA